MYCGDHAQLHARMLLLRKIASGLFGRNSFAHVLVVIHASLAQCMLS